jgi:hypothetical protein
MGELDMAELMRNAGEGELNLDELMRQAGLDGSEMDAAPASSVDDVDDAARYAEQRGSQPSAREGGTGANGRAYASHLAPEEPEPSAYGDEYDLEPPELEPEANVSQDNDEGSLGSSKGGLFALRLDKSTLSVLRRWTNFANGVLLLLLGPVTLAISAASLSFDKMVLAVYVSYAHARAHSARTRGAPVARRARHAWQRQPSFRVAQDVRARVRVCTLTVCVRCVRSPRAPAACSGWSCPRRNCASSQSRHGCAKTSNSCSRITDARPSYSCAARAREALALRPALPVTLGWVSAGPWRSSCARSLACVPAAIASPRATLAPPAARATCSGRLGASAWCLPCSRAPTARSTQSSQRSSRDSTEAEATPRLSARGACMLAWIEPLASCWRAYLRRVCEEAGGANRFDELGFRVMSKPRWQ